MRSKCIVMVIVALFPALAGAQEKSMQPISPIEVLEHMELDDTNMFHPSPMYKWLDVLLEVSAREVERIGARPTILSRQMAICVTGAYDAWSAYDAKAVSTRTGSMYRRPEAERTMANKQTAIAYAMYRTLLDQYPHFEGYLRAEMERMGYDPGNHSMNPKWPEGIGNIAAKELLDYRHHDGANQLGDEIGSNGQAYSDYTMYKPVNPPEREITKIDPDRWQPLPFADGKGGHFYPGFLTPHWYRVKPFALERGDQFRPGPPPLAGSKELKDQVDECIEMNANLAVEEKAIVEFMRDGPRSTAQSGHWLRFAQDVARRDKNGLDADVKLFFSIGNVCMDAFIASWDSKRYYDSSRPWTLIRWYYQGQTIRGWAGPGEGVKEIPAAQWHPYSPATFVTPPFPGYTSGHSTVSGASAEMLKLFTGSDQYAFVAKRTAGSLTEEGFDCEEMQQVDGKLAMAAAGAHLSCDVVLKLPTFSETAEMAGISRVLGGYHIQADNIAGLNLGRAVAKYSWPVYETYFNGTAHVMMKSMAATGKMEKVSSMN